MGRSGLWFLPFAIWMVLFSGSPVKAEGTAFTGSPQLAAILPPQVQTDYQNSVETGIPETFSPAIWFDIPITINERVEYFIRYFQAAQRERFSTWLSRSTRYIPRMREILRENGLPEDLVYLALIESGFNMRAYSPAHACGPWQFIKETGGRYGLKVNKWLDERCDLEKATRAAAGYLGNLYREFGCWYLAAAGYNAGENRVRRGIVKCETGEFWEMCDNGLFPRETEDYVPKMIAAAIIAKNPEKYGFTEVQYQEPVSCVRVSVPPGTDLKAVALACGVDEQVMKDLNPELRRGCTPPWDHYKVDIPEDTVPLFKDNFCRIRTTVRRGYHRYVAEKGDTLAKIAEKFDVSPRSLARANKIKRRRSIKKGRVLRVPYQAREYALCPKKAKSVSKMAARTFVIQAAAEGRDGTAEVSQIRVRYYKVRRGDTLWNISQRYNVTPADIRFWNNMHKSILIPGTRLKIQASSSI